MTFPLSRLLYGLEPERAHHAGLLALKAWGGLVAPFSPPPGGECPVHIAGLTFSNPVGLAAGLDKDGEAIDGLFGLGFGSVEVGTLTPRPQVGNPRPRLFRLQEDEGIINRMGFNNGGLDAALPRIARARRKGVLGINVGTNKDSVDHIADYDHAVRTAGPVADYLTINVSSPNTPGLRDLQRRPALDELLATCDTARHLPDGRRCPLFFKIAPDLDRRGVEDAVRAAIDHHVDALIVTNTTISRPDGLRSRFAGETGGLSGKPLAPLAREKLAEARAAAGNELPLIAAGGIDSPEEALARLDAGATMIQLYSALVFKGPGLVRAIVKAVAAARAG